MIRLSDSEGLRKILKEFREEYQAQTEDVKSKNFELPFPTDEDGNITFLDLWIGVKTNDFNLLESRKKIRVYPRKDSDYCTFPLKPRKTGELRLLVQVYVAKTLIAEGFFKINGYSKIDEGLQAIKTLVSFSIGILGVRSKRNTYAESIQTNSVDRPYVNESELLFSKEEVKEYLDKMKPVPPDNAQFYMASSLVSNGLYYRFVCENKDYSPLNNRFLEHWNSGKPHDRDRNLPVIFVSVKAAQAFSDWLSKLTGHHIRLPRYEEWEMAMLAGRSKLQCLNEELRKSRVNYIGTSSVMHATHDFSPNPFGIRDLLGNAYDLCLTSNELEPVVLLSGGCYSSTADQLMKPLRVKFDKTCRLDTSFRCVQDV